jgi:hypothetical protein
MSSKLFSLLQLIKQFRYYALTSSRNRRRFKVQTIHYKIRKCFERFRVRNVSIAKSVAVRSALLIRKRLIKMKTCYRSIVLSKQINATGVTRPCGLWPPDSWEPRGVLSAAEIRLTQLKCLIDTSPSCPRVLSCVSPQ